MRTRLFTLILICIAAVSCKESNVQIESIDLLKKIETAELAIETKFVDTGEPTFRRHLLSGWTTDRKERDGTTSAAILQRTAEASFYTDSTKGRILAVRLKIEPGYADTQQVDVLINGGTIRGPSVRRNYQQVLIPIPAHFLVAGQNSIRFVVNVIRQKSIVLAPGISVDYFAFLEKQEVPAKAIPLIADNPKEVRFVQLKKSKSKTVLEVPFPGAIAFYEKISPQTELEIEYGMFREDSSMGTAAQFRATIESENGTREQLFDDTITRRYLVQPCKSKKISLSKYPSQIVRIQIASLPVTGKTAPGKVYLGKVTLSAPRSSVPEKKTISRPQQRPYVFIYLIDALRADHLEAYGYGEPTSPRIRKFADDSVVFENAYAQTAWTRASLASIMTGLYPSSHLTEREMDVLPDFLPTIAGELKANGYSTYGFVTNGNVSAPFGFNRHFTKYDHLREDLDSERIHVQSDKLFERVRSLLDQKLPQPSYLYIHATDPHEPYTPAPFSLNIPSDCPVHDPRFVRPSLHRFGTDAYSPKDLKCLIALYDSEILKADHYFGEFIDLLKRKNLYKNSMIILTADHGEEFLEHGVLKHGQSLYQAEIKVPLLIHFPESQFAGKRIQSYARHIDIFPTILDVIASKIPPGVQGASLLPLAGGSKFDGPVFGELLLGIHFGQYMILHPYKFMDRRRGVKMSQFLFNIVADPEEAHDLSSKNPIRFHYMRTLLKEWTDAQQKRKALLRKPREAILDSESQEALKALGYLH